jgi:hypothetical protein
LGHFYDVLRRLSGRLEGFALARGGVEENFRMFLGAYGLGGIEIRGTRSTSPGGFQSLWRYHVSVAARPCP